jgi:hypothetical protein
VAALRLLCLFIAAALAAAAPGAAQARERIAFFLSDVVIDREGTLHVTETIRLVSEGREIKRGILRDFPTRYERDGRTVRVGFDVESVSRNGAPEEWSTEGIEGGRRIRIGSADRLLDPGVHTYTIRYRTTRQLGFFPDYDELYWNGTGTGWTFPIDLAAVRVRLPEAVPFGARAFYTGAQGATLRNAEVAEESPGDILIRTTRPLGAREGLTIAVAFPKGVVAEPAPPSPAALALAEQLPPAVAVLGVLGLLFYYYTAWQRAGRNPRRGTIVPLFAPPDGMSAAALRYVRRMGYDNRAFAAAIVESGVRGQLRLVEEDRGFLRRDATWIERSEGGKEMNPPERAMLSRLFSGGDEIEVDDKNHATFSAAQGALRRELEKAYKDVLFRSNLGWALAGLLLMALASALVSLALIATDPYAAETAPYIAFIAAAALVGAIQIGRSSRLGTAEGGMLGAWLAGGLAIVGVFALIVSFIDAAETGRLLLVFVPLLILPLALSAFAWMTAPTPEGRAAMDRIEGFRHYLDIAEEDRLEALHPPEKTPELFERYLPHAIALGVENRWAARFAGVLAAAATAPGERNRHMGWYSGSQQPWSNPGRFAAAMGGALASSVASASTAPGSSSGSSGGGSSGGGGGGGGGSGW